MSHRTRVVRGNVAVLFLSQAMSKETFDLAASMAEEIGDTVVVTGTAPPPNLPSGVTVLRAPRYDNTSYTSRAATWLRYVANVIPRALVMRGAPVVFVTTNPPFMPFVAYALRQLRGWPYVVWVWDLYPDAFVQHGLLSRNHPVVRLWQGVNRLALGGASRAVTLSSGMRDAMRAYMPPQRELEIVPTWVNVSELSPLDKHKNPFVTEHGLENVLTVLYSGNLGLTHEFAGVSAAVAALCDEPRIRFLFIGGGARRDELQGLARRYRNVTVLPRQPQHNVPYSMAAGDVALITLGAGIGGVSMPSKTYSYMAAGCALLALSDDDTDLAALVTRTQAGLSVSAQSGAEVTAALQRYLDDPDLLARSKSNARAAAVGEFSADVRISQLIAMTKDARREVVR